MIRNTRDRLAKEISNEKGIDLIQVQEIIDLFLQLIYEEDYVVIKQNTQFAKKQMDSSLSSSDNVEKT
ncbi:hypothetical protein [Niallia alba]|uniref:Uncharacterized protein n=1 Tax=Niallia alba TaxID=2729105 RepID=A0A7Y0PQ36_9BACI|nr:hypothetical protein [Niallia alba]NMO80071.1 hypothetical protein [Niallia alba]